MKKLFAFILALALVFALAGCADKKPETENTQTPSGENTDVPEQKDYTKDYAEVLDKYKTAFDEKWDNQKLAEESMSFLYATFYEDGAAKNIGYYLQDINGDETPELFIGPLKDKGLFLDLYTLQNGKAVQVFSGMERNSAFLRSDGTILNLGSNSAAQSGSFLVKLEGAELKITEGVLFDATADRENPWYATDNDDWEPLAEDSLTESQAQAKIDEYQNGVTAIEYIAFENYASQSK